MWPKQTLICIYTTYHAYYGYACQVQLEDTQIDDIQIDDIQIDDVQIDDIDIQIDGENVDEQNSLWRNEKNERVK